MLESKHEMFDRDPSGPVRKTATHLKSAGAERVLGLGGGQGRDSLFFAAERFQVHVLDYAQAGVDAILRKAAHSAKGSPPRCEPAHARPSARSVHLTRAYDSRWE